jgi:hypothetical protein
MTTSLDQRPAGGRPSPRFGQRAREPRPIAWLVAAGAAVVAGLALAVGPLTAPDRFPFALVFAAWVLCGPLAIMLLAGFTVADAAAQARTLVVPSPGLRVCYWVVFVAALAGIVLSAWSIAQFVGRL